MGRNRKNQTITVIILFPLVFLAQSFTYGQLSISGEIKDENNNPLFSASVVIKDTVTNSILKYTYSNNKGEYNLVTNKTGTFKLIFSSLGFKTTTLIIKIDGSLKEIHNNVILVKNPYVLDEVLIQPQSPVFKTKDTIRFKTKYFVKGTEKTVEDLLKNIPGLSIDKNGTIKVGHQEIEKLMIDGDDLFEKGYKILSKNMPAYPIEEVEVLKNYSNNRLLKGVEESNKVALNLKLNEKSKRIWFGNSELGYGYNNFYDMKINLMNFGNKNKYYFLTGLNNIGEDATGDINHLIRPFRVNEPASIGDNQQVNNLIYISSTSLDFNKKRTNFNNAELFSFNAIFNPIDKLKIKTLAFFNWDEQDFFRNSAEFVTANGTNFTNTEEYKLRNKTWVGFGKLDFSYNISKNKMLESTTKYNDGDINGRSNLIFNGTSTIENLQSNNTLFDQKITYSNKFKDKKVFLLTGRFIDEKSPQKYSINQFFYQDLFPSFSDANNVQQASKNQMQFAGFEAHLFDRKKSGNLLEFQLGNEYRKDKLRTTFSLLENTNFLDNPSGFQNNTTYQTNDLYFKTKYLFKLKDFIIIGKLGFHQLFNQLKFDDFSKNQTPFFINPTIGLDWEMNENNRIKSSYSLNTTNAKTLEVYNGYTLTGFNSFSKGIGDFNQLNASSLLFGYHLGNITDRFFANAFLFYNENFDFFSRNTLINQNYSISEKIKIHNQKMISITTKLNYYLKNVSSNLKLNLGYSKSNYKNIINDSDLREVTSNNYNYGLELRSGFKGVFNYHIGTKWTTQQIETLATENSFTNNVSFLDLSFVFNEEFNIQLQTERYFFGNLDKDNNTYYFLDFDARYTVKKNKLTLALTGQNLFNTNTFKTFSITDISTSTTEYRLLPRFILLKMEYRF